MILLNFFVTISVLCLLSVQGFRGRYSNVIGSTRNPLYSIINNRAHEEATKRGQATRPFVNRGLKQKGGGEKKDQLADAIKPKIKRVQNVKRVSLDQLYPGQKVKGRIISIAPYGLFVDVGTSRDGLLHIKEVSNSYFVQDLESKFYPGQDLDVWVKLVDKPANKLQLQLYPVKPAVSLKPTIAVDQLEEMEKVMGTAVKYSNFGIFVDIGMGNGDLAFLHRRKIKLTKKQRKYMPWEIIPLGAEVEGYVHTLDIDRRRVGLTTFAPEDWEYNLPDEEDSTLEQDDEEQGGTARADNLRALENTLNLALDDDDDDDDLDDDNDATGGSGNSDLFTDEELQELMLSRQKSAKLLIDDVGDTEDTDDDSSDKEGKQRTASTGEEASFDQLSIEELFDSISGGREVLMLKDLKKWDYLREMLASKELTEHTLISLVGRAGGKQTNLREEHFQTFVELLVDHLELADAEREGELDLDNVDDLDVDQTEKTKKPAPATPVTLLMDDFAGQEPAAVCTSTNKRLHSDRNSEDQDQDQDQDEDFIPEITSYDPTEGSDQRYLSSQTNSGSASNDLLATLFTDLAGKGKSSIGLSAVMKWDLVAGLLAEGLVTGDEVEQVFKSNASKTQGVDEDVLGREGFSALMSFLSKVERNSEGNCEGKRGMEGAAGASNDNDEHEDGAEITLEDAFFELCGDEEYITYEELTGWNIVSDLVEARLLSNEQLKEFFEQCSPESCSRRGVHGTFIKFQGFENFLDLIEPYAAELYDEKDAMIEAEEIDEDSLADSGKDGPSGSISRTLTTYEEDADSQEEILLANVFKGLANGKDFVSMKDLMGWDFVLDLMAEGLLSESSLEDLLFGLAAEADINRSKGNRIVSLQAFDRLVDSLVDLYKDAGEGEAPSQESRVLDLSLADDDSMMEVDEVDDAVMRELRNSRGDYREEEEEELEGYEDEEDNEEVLEISINIEKEFDKLAKGADSVTYADLLRWELLEQLITSEQVTDKEIREICSKLGLDQSSEILIDDFEAVLEEIMLSTEQYEMGGGHDHGLSHSHDEGSGDDCKVCKDRTDDDDDEDDDELDLADLSVSGF